MYECKQTLGKIQLRIYFEMMAMNKQTRKSLSLTASAISISALRQKHQNYSLAKTTFSGESNGKFCMLMRCILNNIILKFSMPVPFWCQVTNLSLLHILYICFIETEDQDVNVGKFTQDGITPDREETRRSQCAEVQGVCESQTGLSDNLYIRI